MLKIPTDNINKFIAISGIAITIFFVSLNYTQELELRTNNVEIEKQLIVYNHFAEKYETQIEVTNLWCNNADELSSSPGFIEDWEKEIEKLNKREFEYINQQAEIESLLSQQRIKLDNYKKYKFLYWLATIIGLTMTVYGFSNWNKETKK